ncbi:hypothetical protein OG455_28150 [Kitasatospora sp. NBC_01287]|uniref:hypothetical protein n=1 Tax=Kitasatospora sp. NBC_01287 TaxID=2903573 RepID=UPI00224FFCED|nr:hypothetical protein [Kitasatospora sp. NBC_01287]MCX4749334.1 hypothetical protein [Kitasatospora sp. NBC_01287]
MTAGHERGDPLSRRSVVRLAVSGRMAAGKDTIALEAATRCSSGPLVVLRFGSGIVDEVDRTAAEISRAQQAGSGPRSAVRSAARLLELAEEQVEPLVRRLWAEIAEHGAGIIRNRTAAGRGAMQYWGVARRADDPLVWVRSTLAAARAAHASGSSVVVPDVRSGAEADALRAEGFLLVRVNASDDTRLRRLRQRDALTPPPQALEHVSETELDDYPHFALQVDNDLESEVSRSRAVEQVVRALLERIPAENRG